MIYRTKLFYRQSSELRRIVTNEGRYASIILLTSILHGEDFNAVIGEANDEALFW